MKRIRFTALFMTFCLMFGLMTACGSTSADSSTSAAESAGITEAAEEAVDESGIPVAALEDPVSYLTDGAYTVDTVLTTIGDQEITAGQVLYWAAYQYYYMSYYYSMYGSTVDVSQEVDGVTLAQSLIDDALDSAVAYAICHQEADDMDLTLDDDTIAMLAEFYDGNVEYYGEARWESTVEAGLINEEDFTDEEKEAWILEEGERYYDHSMSYFSTSADSYYALAENSYYYGMMSSAMFEDGGKYAPSEATMNDYLQSYAEDNGICWARCILFSTSYCADDDAIAEVKAQADAAYEELSALTGDELSARFTELQEEYDGSGYTAGEIQIYYNTDSLIDGYYDGIQALEVGQVGMTDQTDYGYFILLREDGSSDEYYDDAFSQYTSDTFDSLIVQWRSEYAVSFDRNFSDIDLVAYFENLQTLQDLIGEADTIEAAEDETAEDAETADTSEADAEAADTSEAEAETADTSEAAD